MEHENDMKPASREDLRHAQAIALKVLNYAQGLQGICEFLADTKRTKGISEVNLLKRFGKDHGFGIGDKVHEIQTVLDDMLPYFSFNQQEEGGVNHE